MLTTQNLAERISDPKDWRGYLFRLTPQGLSVVSGMMDRLIEAFSRHLRPMKDVAGALAVFEDMVGAVLARLRPGVQANRRTVRDRHVHSPSIGASQRHEWRHAASEKRQAVVAEFAPG